MLKSPMLRNKASKKRHNRENRNGFQHSALKVQKTELKIRYSKKIIFFCHALKSYTNRPSAKHKTAMFVCYSFNNL